MNQGREINRIILSAQPIITRLLKYSYNSNLDDIVFDSKIQLSPGVWRYSPSIISLPGEFERAISAIPTSSLSVMQSLIKESDHYHSPTTMFYLKNALICDGCLYKNLRYKVISPSKRRPIVISMGKHYSEAQLSSEPGEQLYFGHWLLDGTSTELLAKMMSIKSLIFERKDRFHEESYRNLLELQSDPVEVALIDRLQVIDDRGFNDNRLQRYLSLVELIRSKGNRSKSAGQYIFLVRRGGKLPRILCNELELYEELSKIGFNFLDYSNLSAHDISSAFMDAKIVVSVEGSHLSHALLSMPSKSLLITIQPPSAVNLGAYKFFADSRNIRSAFIIGGPRKDDFYVDYDRLIRLIDFAVSRL